MVAVRGALRGEKQFTCLSSHLLSHSCTSLINPLIYPLTDMFSMYVSLSCRDKPSLFILMSTWQSCLHVLLQNSAQKEPLKERVHWILAFTFFMSKQAMQVMTTAQSVHTWLHNFQSLWLSLISHLKDLLFDRIIDAWRISSLVIEYVFFNLTTYSDTV